MTALRARVDALRASGADVFDGPGFVLVEALLARAEALGGEGGARLEARAAARVGLLEAAMTRETETVRRELEDMGDAAPAVAREAVTGGDLRGARRSLRRARFEVARARQRVDVPWAARLGSAATARGELALARELTSLCESGVIDRGSHAEAVALGSAVSSALFRSSADSARAAVAIARSTDSLPDSAGPYNAQVLAVRALMAMAELSPDYAGVVVAALDDLSTREAQLAPVPSKTKTRPVRKGRGGSTR